MKKYLLSALATVMVLSATAQWQIQNAGFINDTLGFYEMSLPNAHTVWAVCYDGKGGLLSGRPVLDFTRTTDGGNTWIPGKMGNDKTLRFSNISAIDEQEAWVAMNKIGTFSPITGSGFAGGGGIFHTTDAGVSWQHVLAGELFNSSSVPRFVYFKDKNHGITVGDPNDGYFEVYLTNNKGKKWKRVARAKLPEPLANEVGWISGYAVTGNTLWFGTSAGRMYKSIDFGQTWTVHIVDPLPGTAVNEIAFLDDGLHGVAHLRGRSRTFVFSTSDGGLTWTNYFQPANWKNSRMTAVPGTNAFISTAVHGNPLFRGSAVSYDVGQTWTEIERSTSKAVCRFFDANTGYAGGFFLTGPPLIGGIYKSQIVFPNSAQMRAVTSSKAPIVDDGPAGKFISIYPSPASHVINISLADEFVGTTSIIQLVSLDGKVMETRRSASAKRIQLNVSKFTPGMYMIRVTANQKSSSHPVTIVR